MRWVDYCGGSGERHVLGEVGRGYDHRVPWSAPHRSADDFARRTEEHGGAAGVDGNGAEVDGRREVSRSSTELGRMPYLLSAGDRGCPQYVRIE